MRNRKLITTIVMAFVFVLAASTAGMAQRTIKGNGIIKKEERKVSGFKAIQIGGAFEVSLKQGSSEFCYVEADENLLEYIETRVVGGILKISTSKSIKNPKALNIYIGVKDLDLLDLSGACEFKSEGRIKTEDLELEISGASEVNLSIDVNALELDLSGASEVELVGSAKAMKADCSGASELEAFGLEVTNADIEASGASEADINVTGMLIVDASGASSIDYKGNPDSVKKDLSGAADIDKY
jgi:Putative auto-transporter adhesin, head GIN domain